MGKITEPEGIMYHLPNKRRYYGIRLPGRTPGTFQFKANAETLELLRYEESLFCWKAVLFVNGRQVWEGSTLEVAMLRGRRYPKVIHYFIQPLTGP